MGRLYLIGGGPGAGKSSIAEALAKKYGFEYWRADDFVGEHQPRAAERNEPINNYIEELPDKEQPLELLKLTAKQELKRQEELFALLREELQKRQIGSVILEGNCLLPKLVAQLSIPYQGVWLMPTLEFQKELYPQRDWAKSLLKSSRTPELTLQNWIQRDHEYNQIVERQAKTTGEPYLWIKPGQSLESTLRWVERQLRLATTARSKSYKKH